MKFVLPSPSDATLHRTGRIRKFRKPRLQLNNARCLLPEGMKSARLNRHVEK